MPLDTATLTALLCLQLLTMALALSAFAGWRSSRALRWAVAGMWVQLGSWLLVLLTPWLGLAATALSYSLGALTFVMTLQAVAGWIGPRAGLRTAWALAWLPLPAFLLSLALPALEGPLQRGISNLATAGCVALLLWGLLASAPEAAPGSRRWRNAMALPLLGLMLLTLWRALLGLQDSAAYPSLRSGHPVALAVLVVGNLATIISALAFLAAWRGEAEALLRQAALSDPLTGLANRRALERRSQALLQEAERHGDGLLALMIDIDHFKRINDERGHAAGDAALALMGRLLVAQLRPGDCAARLGGEEFALLLSRSGAGGAQALDARLRAALREAAPRELGFALDYSAGWTRRRAGDRDVHDLLQRADAALYQAKRSGRSRLCAAPGDEEALHEA